MIMVWMVLFVRNIGIIICIIVIIFIVVVVVVVAVSQRFIERTLSVLSWSGIFVIITGIPGRRMMEIGRRHFTSSGK